MNAFETNMYVALSCAELYIPLQQVRAGACPRRRCAVLSLCVFLLLVSVPLLFFVVLLLFLLFLLSLSMLLVDILLGFDS